MADIQINDEASLEAWLKTRPRGDAEIIAFRAAARVFPLWGRAMGDKTLVIDRRTKKEAVSILPILRALLSAQILAISQNHMFRTNASYIAAQQAEIEAKKLRSNKTVFFESPALRSAYFAAISTAASAGRNTMMAVTESRKVRGTFFSPRYLGGFSSSWDEENFEIGTLSLVQNSFGQKYISFKLWSAVYGDYQQPDWFTKADRETRAIWAKDRPTWAFWEKWWDGVISGDMPFAPELLRDVALIEDDIWQAGPKAVAQAIARIEKIHDLRVQLDALMQAIEDEDLSQAQRGATLAHRGHNNPPEIIEAYEIEAYEIAQSSAVTIVQALDDAREELAMPAPEPSRLQAIGNGMLSAIMKAAGYCGGLANKFLQEFVGEMGKQAATIAAWLIKGGIGVSLLSAFAKSMIAIWPF